MELSLAAAAKALLAAALYAFWPSFYNQSIIGYNFWTITSLCNAVDYRDSSSRKND